MVGPLLAAPPKHGEGKGKEQGKGPGGKGQGLGEDLHIAYFRGVDNAEAIRDLILARLRNLRGAGLGDPDEDHRRHAPVGASTASSAARVLLDEARALRLTLERG